MIERRPLPYAWPDVRGRLQARIGALLSELFPGARLQGAAPFTPLNPTRCDRSPGSFVIWTHPLEGAGAWKEYATGEAGDVFGLIAYVRGLARPIDAYWWALEFLGLERGTVRSKAQDLAARERAERERRAAEARAEAESAARARALFAAWLTLKPIWGTVAETYLREARGIPLDRIVDGRGRRAPLGALRFDPRRAHLDKATGELTEWPCLVSAMTRGAAVVGLHQTWLAPDGGGKAPVASPKKMAGRPLAGAAIRLTAGPSGLSPSEAAKRGPLDRAPLCVGEGIETTLTVAAARPDYRCWAAGSLALMGALDWPECASAAVLLQDNDWGEEARAAFGRAEQHWRDQARGRPVKVVGSRVGNDFNDWAQAGRRAA